MAKRRNSSYSSVKRGSLYSNAKRQFAFTRLSALPSLSPLYDRRLYHPLREYAPAATLGYLKSRTIVDTPSGKRPSVIKFAVPPKVAVCVRRNVRREVILALGRGGRGARTPKRRNVYSSVSCKD